MLADQFIAAAGAVRTYAAANTLSADLWRAHAAGLIPDEAAQAAAEAIQCRRRQIGDRIAKSAPVAFPARLRVTPRSQDREASIRRRRAAATSGAVPSRIAGAFTTGEAAVLSVIAAEVRRSGSCAWPMDRIAAMAGVSRRTAQYAVRAAERLGLIAVKARPRPGAKSDTNIIRITSKDWLSWLRLAGHRMQKTASHGKQLIIYPVEAAVHAVDNRLHSCSVPFSKAGSMKDNNGRRSSRAFDQVSRR